VFTSNTTTNIPSAIISLSSLYSPDGPAVLVLVVLVVVLVVVLGTGDLVTVLAKST